MRLTFRLLPLLVCVQVFCINPLDIANELDKLSYWDTENLRPPSYQSNYLLQSGQLFTPSAFPFPYGTLGAGGGQSFPYRWVNLMAQPFSRLQVSGNFRLYQELPSLDLGEKYGEKSDKGIGMKYLLVCPEDFSDACPYISCGADDFLGTKAFKTYYLVASQNYFKCLDLSAGYGTGHLQGFFGGLTFSPFGQLPHLLDQFSFVLEYDATAYRPSPYTHDLYQTAVKDYLIHKKGEAFYYRLDEKLKVKSPFNAGIFFRVANCINFNLSYNRGKHLGGSVALVKNMENTRDFIPKIQAPTPYTTPVNHEPLGELRRVTEMPYEFYYAFKNQGFVLEKVHIQESEHGKDLHLFIQNTTYWNIEEAKVKLIHLVATLAPENVGTLSIHMIKSGLVSHTYAFNVPQLLRFRKRQTSLAEITLATPSRDYTSLPSHSQSLFSSSGHSFQFRLAPFLSTFWGSSRGKMKYAVGIKAPVKGFFTPNFFYSLEAIYHPISNLKDLSDRDKNNPSQLINVQSDKGLYLKRKTPRLHAAYLQKNLFLEPKYFMRISGGYFNFAYAGAASEILYSPAQSLFACGIELAALKKRRYTGLGLSNRVRQLQGSRVVYKKFLGVQSFFDAYFKIPSLHSHIKVSLGQFLARDKGVKLQLYKHFSSGLTLSSWVTLTDANDQVNGSRYHDYGFSLEVPFEIFATKRLKNQWHYGMSAWLRDVGYRSSTGESLYDTISKEQGFNY